MEEVVTVTDEEQEINMWCTEHCSCVPDQDNPKILIGFDTAWRPDRGQFERTAVVQLAVQGAVLLAQVYGMATLPADLVRVLQDPLAVKGGTNMESERRRLERSFPGVQLRGQVDLSVLANDPGAGIASLVAHHLHLNMPKSSNITISDWSVADLSSEQANYAALGTTMAYRLLCKLNSGRSIFCDLCRREVPEHELQSHKTSEQHIAMDALSRLLDPITQQNKGDVIVSSAKEMEKQLTPCAVGQAKAVKITIENRSHEETRTLRTLGLIVQQEGFSLEDMDIALDNVVLHPRTRHVVEIKFEPKNYGAVKPLLVFDFDKFKITRPLELTAMDPGDHQLLQATAPYEKRRRYQAPPTTYEIAAPRFNIVSHGVRVPIPPKPNDNDAFRARSVLAQPLSLDSHFDYMRALVTMEDMQGLKDMRDFDIKSATLRSTSHALRFTVEVAGLAEGRPCILVGDRVKCIDEGVGYFGRVVDTEQSSVILEFTEPFLASFSHGKSYHVSFEMSLRPGACCVYGLKRAHMNRAAVERFAFPETLPAANEDLELADIDCISTLNTQQIKAVKTILATSPHRFQHPRPLPPFVVFGPPGTGKTTVVVETILQVLRDDPSTFVLACAPSNEAADLVLRRAVERGGLTHRDAIRVNAVSRSVNSVREDIVRFSPVGPDNKFRFPTAEEVASFRLVVSTCVNSSRFAFEELEDHFTHVFIDEAGHATEPETMIPLGCFACKRVTRVVLAGDPKQLGPVVRSPLAMKKGLSVSLLERLTTLTRYQGEIVSGTRDAVMLCDNYRSHQVLLQLPSSLFYGGVLNPCAQGVSSLVNFVQLPTKGVPLLFHSIQGRDERESCSPSWFNTSEAGQVADYIGALIGDRALNPPVVLADIGIISPYRRQVEKLRKLFQKRRWDDVQVGSVEQFQGQEKRIVVITTVRSDLTHAPFDMKYNIGFLDNPKRFNVALTRAKELCIIIGNATTLSTDPHWKALWQYSQEKGGCRGVGPTSGDETKARAEELYGSLEALRAFQPETYGARETPRETHGFVDRE